MTALVTLVVIAVMGVSVQLYTSSNQTAATRDNALSSASHVAESGLAAALARLTSQLTFDETNRSQGTLATAVSIAPSSQALLPKCDGTTGSLATIQFPDVNGTTTFCGDWSGAPTDTSGTWKLVSTGAVTKGGSTSRATMSQTVTIDAHTATNVSSWNRFLQYGSGCLTIDTVTMPASIATKGDLCLIHGASITGSATQVDVAGKVTISGTTGSSGTTSPRSASGTSWSNPSYVYSNDNSYATYPLGSAATSNTLTASNFGFSIPSTASITGITVRIYRFASSTNTLRDATVQLQKSGSAVGSNYADTGSYWSTSSSSSGSYGGSSDLWGTTWTPADLNASSFGVRLAVKNYSSSSRTPSVDQVTVSVSYVDSPGSIGTSATPVTSVSVQGNCQLNTNPAHHPCSSADNVYATTIGTTAASVALTPPLINGDVLDAWYMNGAPGPKHGCGNANPNISPLIFDQPSDVNMTTSDDDVHYNDTTDDITPDDRSYTCKSYDANGFQTGELSWDLPNRVLTVSGTIFFDGDVRFDSDGAVTHYHGRAMIYAAGDVEFDEMVCAGGTGTQSCYNDMSNWNADQNYLVLMAGHNSEYDQGGTYCPNSQYGRVCPSGYSHPISGFQGVVAASGTCTIHEKFALSGPVLCNRVSLPHESDGWPTYYPFPTPSNLVDGQTVVELQDANAWAIEPGSIANG